MYDGIQKSKIKRWAEGAIVYQIYPRSFFDSNNDGIGDIKGITHKLSYLSHLGVNVLWLSPFYTSPMADFGYDVADYESVDPIFGKLGDLEELIQEAHIKDIKIIIDLVPNHTSDQHIWFRQSKQSKENRFSDWYIWRDAKGMDKKGNPIPPNNWRAQFSGDSAWEWDPTREQFYMHTFDVAQPDLNWTNHNVRKAMHDVMRFWLDRGVDGFRVDAVPFIGKDPLLKDEPKNPHWDSKHGHGYDSLIHTNNQYWPNTYVYLAEMANILKEPKYIHRHRFMVTEGYPNRDAIETYLDYFEGMDPEVAAPFIFEGFAIPWEAKPWRNFLKVFHTALDVLDPLCLPSYAFGNHDQPRLVSRLGEDIARAVAVFGLTLPGLAFIYNGEEIGMHNVEIPKEQVQDPSAKGSFGRDPVRTPLQWNTEEHAGFTKAHHPWLPVADDFKENNIAVQLQNPVSFLSLYMKLTKLRNNSSALKHGSFKVISVKQKDVLAFVREDNDEKIMTLINFADKTVDFQLDPGLKLDKFLVSSCPEPGKYKSSGEISMKPYEAVVFKVNKLTNPLH